MRQINALKEYLKVTTKRYNNGEPIPVEFGDTPHVKYDQQGNPTVVVSPNVKKWLGKDIPKEQELRCIIDDTSHEVEHPRRTPQNAKKEFMECYPNCPKAAGRVWNLLEDVYIDKKRTDKLKGLRKTRAFIIDKVLDNSYRHKKISSFDELPNAAMEGIFQVTQAGYAKGISEIQNDELKEFLAWVRKETLILKQIGGSDEEENITDDSIPGDGYYGEREELYHTVMEEFLDLIGTENTDEVDEAAEDTDMISGEDVDEDELDFQETPENEKRKEKREQDKETEQSGNNQLDDEETEDIEKEEGSGESSTDSDEVEKENESERDNSSSRSQNSEEYEDDAEPSENAEQKEDSPLEKVPEAERDEESETANGSAETEIPDGDEPQGGSESESSENREDNTEEEIDDGESDEFGTPRNETLESNQVDEDAEDALLEHQVDEMEKLDEKGESGSWFDVSEEADYTNVESRFKERYEEIQEVKDRDNTATAEKIRKRDELIDDRSSPDEIYRLLEERGLADEITEAFEELKTRDRWVNTNLGQRVDTRKAVRRAAGDTTVNRLYERKQRAEIGDRAIAVALDLSGSMSETDAKMALAALEMAASIIGDQFTACGYKSFKPSDSNYNVITTPLITGPNEEFKREHLNSVWAGGRTPMASGIIEASELLQECTKSEDVLIVVTDGKPNLTSDGGSGKKRATEEARQRVRELKRAGVKVIGLGIGSINPNSMDNIFEGDFVTAEMNDFAEKLIEIYYNQMDVA